MADEKKLSRKERKAENAEVKPAVDENTAETIATTEEETKE